MADAVRCDQWDHTAALLCQTANTYRDPKSRPIPFHRFHPYRRAPDQSQSMTAQQLHELRHLFPLTNS